MVAQNADACAFWKLTFNRDFRSTEFQEIKINSCPALAASWGQCLLRGVLGTTEIFGWRSSSSLTGCAPLPHTFLWHLRPTAAFPFLMKIFQLQVISRVFTNIIFTVVTHKGALNRAVWVPHLSSKHPTPPLTGWWNETTTPSSTSPGPCCCNEEDFNRNVSLPPAQAAIKMFGTAFPVVSVWTVKIRGEMWLNVPGFVLKPTIIWRSCTFPRIFSMLISGLQWHCCSQWHYSEMSRHPTGHPRGTARF